MSARHYLRKADLCKRYGWKAKISVDRAVKAGTLPPPDTYIGPAPLWLEEHLDAHDDAQRKARAETIPQTATA
jgi:hypothetical protein